MLRQAFSTSSRALCSAPRSTASASLLRSQFQTTAPAFSLRATQPSASRWYSDAKETKETPASEEKGEAKGESEVLAELKKNLEAKDAEARDWKVTNNLYTNQDWRNILLSDQLF